jgi:cytochrome c oxidase cbb3-type subunit 2
MKNGPLLFLGLFASLGLSWGALALGTNAQLGGLAPYFDRGEETAFPSRSPGIASRGQLIYQDLGCAACHTQAVRRPGYGNDIERGWGTRQSVARDYIHQDRPQLGQMRVGPDLTSYGARLEKSEKDPVKREQAVYALLYHGTATMPAYPFLFEERPADVQPSPFAVGHKDDREIIPTSRARELAAYLTSLKTSYDYPEAKPFAVAPEGKKEGGHE